MYSKTRGGLGIRKSKAMNKALVAKIGWRLFQDRHSLWSQILRSKHKVGDIHDLAWIGDCSKSSSTWRSIAKCIREVMDRGKAWVIGNGRNIRFWSD